MVGRKIRKAYRGRQVPHGKQSVRKLMAHGTATNRIELSGDAKSFDRVARKWNVDYAFYKTGPDKYLLFFKARQADAMTACFSAVSYTHLDVYKRQYQHRPTRSPRSLVARYRSKARKVCFFQHHLPPKSHRFQGRTHKMCIRDSMERILSNSPA